MDAMHTNEHSSVEAGGTKNGELPNGELPAVHSGNGADHPAATAGGGDSTLAGWGRDTTAGALPLLPAAPGKADVAAAADLLRAASRFHRGDLERASVLQLPGDDWLPALLHPFRNPAAVRNDYPLFLFAADAGADARLVAPLTDVLRETVEGFASASDDVRLLKDNLARLELRVREHLGDAIRAQAAEVIGQAGNALVAELALAEQSRAQLVAGLDKLVAALPRGGTLLSLVEQTPLVLFTHVARRRALLRRSELGREIGKLRHKLDDLLRVDRGKDSRAPEALADSVGSGGSAHVDAAALARILGAKRGAVRMDAQRRRRVEDVIAVFDRYLAAEPSLMTVVTGSDAPLAGRGSGVEWRTVAADAVCVEAAAAFDVQARESARLFSALRVARLELAGAYDPDRHDLLVSGFGWDAFTDDELASLPPVVALESAEHLAGAGMVSLSHLLLSGRPVEVLVTVQPAASPGAALQDDPAAGFRFELGYLGLSHREALVHQSSAARPLHLVEGFLRSIAATRASLHVIAGGLDADGYSPRLGAWLYGGAALEGRAHPFFHYDPQAGGSWAKRLSFDGNPQCDEDWPVYELPCRRASGEDAVLRLASTFADFALLERRYRHHFRAIPPAVSSDELIPVAEYLALDAAESAGRLPFLWSVDGDGRCHRLVVSRALIAVCRDRLGYWHTLQELAGVSNEHVREAVAAERSRLEAVFSAERARLADEKEQEIREAAEAAAGRAMQKLAETLLETDFDALAVAPSSRATPAVVPGAPAAAVVEAQVTPVAAAAAAPPDDEGTEEAWIDSVLCTTCNDCTNLNNRLFVYNSNKQAIIADLSAGTYAELVTAAEKCPARCIHPGKPLNASEPDLDELVKRAARFN